MKNLDVHWLYPLKRRVLFGILGILALTIIATTAFIFLALRNGLDQKTAGSGPRSSDAPSRRA